MNDLIKIALGSLILLTALEIGRRMERKELEEAQKDSEVDFSAGGYDDYLAKVKNANIVDLSS